MSSRFTIVESSLNRAEFRWKWLRFLKHSFLLGTGVSLVLLGFGIAIMAGWIASKAAGIIFFSSVAILGFLAWVIAMIAIIAGSTDRNWLAAALERVDRRLLDRLNTLLFLEKRREQPFTDSFALRIAQQTRGVMADKRVPKPFKAIKPLPYFLAFLVALSVTIGYYKSNSPWKKLRTAEIAKASQAGRTEKPFELPPPTTNNVEADQNWGEVRITDPGADLKVTKVDVVPMQIEAAANQPLNKVGWVSAVNGAAEARHELPPPTEPRYAVYQPTVYLDELNLSDWDVMTYYAKANTEKENSFASEMYFLEVRPFREDILKLPGGEQGSAYKCLNQLTTLINRQQHVIRQTHQHIQKPPAQETLRRQDRQKLSDAETDLGDSTDHLYAQMAAEMENKPIGQALDSLGKASGTLDEASTLLKDDSMTEAPNRERRALMELVAARKMFQKALNENPDAFSENPKEGDDDPVKSPDAARKLQQIAEFRNEAKAAQQFMQKTLEQQRAIEQQARAARPNDAAKLAEREQHLQKGLEDFQQQHPKSFKGAEAESKSACEAMSKAAKALANRSSDVRPATQEATRELEQLSQAMAGNAAGEQLANAYRLKQLLEDQIKQLGNYADSTNSLPAENVQKTAEQSRETINELKKVAEQEPTRDAFGQPLRDALSGTNKVDLDTKLTQLQQAQGDDEKKQHSNSAKEGLGKIARAFEASEPKTTQAAQKSDSLKPGEQDSFGQGMAELASLLNRLENERQPSPQDRGKQAREALYNLQTGMRSQYGDNERGTQIIVRLEKWLAAETPLEVADLKKLMDELQHFSVETSDKLAKNEEPDVTNIDPSRLPPAYRGRIQKYFQKLSEK